MTTYKLPPEPDAETLWVTSTTGNAFRCTREPHGGPIATWALPSGNEMTWADLLALGTVTDHHPDLPESLALPVSVEDDQPVVRDRQGRHIAYVSSEQTSREQDRAHAALIVRALNQYAELVDPAERVGRSTAEEDLLRVVRRFTTLWQLLTDERIRAIDHECGGLVQLLSDIASADLELQRTGS